MLVLVAFAATYFISATLELSERFVSWSRVYEETYDLDELPLALLTATIALSWFSWRRWQDAMHEISTRIATEQQLLKSRSEYELLFSESLTANAILAPDGQVRMCNPAFAMLVGSDTQLPTENINFGDLIGTGTSWLHIVQTVSAASKMDMNELILNSPSEYQVHTMAHVVGQFDRGILQSLHLYATDITKIRQAESEIRELLQQNHRLLMQLLQTQEDERRRIAQDLHDDMGQYLNAIKTNATCITLDKELSTATDGLAHDIISHSDYIYRAIRGMIHRLRPVALDDLGLAAAIRHLVDTWHKPEQGTHLDLSIAGNIDELNERVADNVFRIIQEGLSNAARHARASHIAISLTLAYERLDIRIVDNGVGMDVDTPRAGLGLIGMRERIDSVGGRFSISSLPGHGVKIEASIPVRISKDS